MKVKDFLTQVIAPKLGNEDFNKALGEEGFSLDTEFSEDQAKALKGGVEGLLTKEAALSNPEIIGSIKEGYGGSLKKSIYSSLDGSVIGLAEKLGVTFDEGMNMEKKLEALKNAEIKGDEKEKIISITNKYNDLQNEFGEYKQQAKLELEEERGRTAKRELFNTQVNELRGYELADAYKLPAVQKGIYNEAIAELQGKATMKVENGEIKVFQKDTELPIFDKNNKELGFRDLAGPIMEPYLRKSDPPRNPPSTPQNPPNTSKITMFSARSRR